VHYDALMEASSPSMQIGEILRGIRQSRSLSLDQAAARAGVSRRFLVSMEQGQGNPSMNTLLRLAVGYGVTLADLVGSLRPDPLVLGRVVDATRLWQTDRGSEALLLVAVGDLELWRWRLAPGDARDGVPHRPRTREILEMHRGTLTVTAGAITRELVAGDVLAFAADQAHRYENRGTGIAEFGLVVHEPVP
jgi:transcriptional regulator with XRE-family HTH domain